MKKIITVSGILFVLLFFLLLIYRLIYGYITYPASTATLSSNYSEFSLVNSKKNIATSKYRDQKQSATAERNTNSSDQKYEKVATLSSSSSNFDTDEKKIRVLTDKYSALIQSEQRSGLQGKRKSELVIGVPPDNFDKMVEELKEVGELHAINIEKIDKTNEYLELNARMTTLKKTRESLLLLKSRNAAVDELINLENRILEIENEIQSGGVSLGEFDRENEFCTIQISFLENKAASKITFIHRFKVALEWSIKKMFLISISFFFFTLMLLLITIFLDKIKILEKLLLVLGKFKS